MTARRNTFACVLGSLALVAVLTGACSSTATITSAATSTVSCATITGSASFSPPLTMFGNAPETTSITLALSRCHASGSAATSVTAGAATATITGGTSACTGLLQSRPVTVTVMWTPSSVHPSVVYFGGFAIAADHSGNSGFTLPGGGKTVKMTGSFAGTNGGATAKASVFTAETATQVLTTCGASATSELSGLTIASGTAVLS